jgi:hypothetical protein
LRTVMHRFDCELTTMLADPGRSRRYRRPWQGWQRGVQEDW